jgi:CRP-like cAMP-binding protein
VIDELLASARPRTFRRGDIVFHEGDPGDSVQLIVRGHFALRLVTPRGDVCMARIYGPGETFGRVAVGNIEAVREATMVALEPAQTLELFRHQIDQLRARFPQVSDALVAVMAMELRAVSERLLEALYIDADRRVRRRLLELSRKFENGVIPLTQEDLAALAGVSRATISRILAEEERRGTIAKRRRKIEVLDAAALSQLAQWPLDPRYELSRT